MSGNRYFGGFAGIAVLSLVIGCVATPVPSSLGRLEKLMADAPPEPQREGAALQWAEAERYLRLARESREGGKDEEAVRMASLGLIHARLAVVSLEEKIAKEETRKLEMVREDLRMALEKHQDAVDRFLLEEERDRMMVHVEAVVDEARLRAAAVEGLSEKAEGASVREKRARARRKVGSEMVARQSLLVSGIRVLVSAGLVEPERLSSAVGAMEVAKKRLEEGDLAGVQEYSERAGMEVRATWNFMWEQAGENLDDARAKLEKDLEGIVGPLEDEELGLSFTLPLSLNGKPLGKWSEKLSRLGERLKNGDAVVVVVSRSKGEGSGDRGAKREEAQAMAVIKVLTGGGVPKKNAVSFPAGNTAPCRGFLDSKKMLAVVVVPVPGP